MITRMSENKSKYANRHAQLADRAWLSERYEAQRQTPKQIAGEINCSQVSVLNALRRHGIQVRGSYQRGRVVCDEGRLRALYLDSSLSTSKIANILGCSRTAVLRALHHYGIPIRSLTESSHARWKVSEDSARKINDEQWLREVYVNQRRPVNSIAKELGMAHGSVWTALNRFGITRRNRSKAAQARAAAARDGYELKRRRRLATIAKDSGEVGKAYTQVRQLLGRLDRVPYTTRENSRLEGEAMDGLYKAEAALAQRLLTRSEN